MTNPQSFCAGYVAVKCGRIKEELSSSEISNQFPRHNVESFSQGMTDALNHDSYRYRLHREDAGIEVWG